MYFESGNLYHIYNQGNNKQRIFFIKENYYYFLRKIRTHVIQYADLLAYCLMPNHFHLMVDVNSVELPRQTILETNDILPGTQALIATKPNLISLNTSIGIMLRSYTRAINNQESRTGALFREETKAICLNAPIKDVPLWYQRSGATIYWRDMPENQYSYRCLNYIHNNPVAAGLVQKPEDWEFSSYKKILNCREGSIVNVDKAKRFLVTG